MADHGYGKIDSDNISEINAPTEKFTAHEKRVAKYLFDAALTKNQPITVNVVASVVISTSAGLTIAAQPDGKNPLIYQFVHSAGTANGVSGLVTGLDSSGNTVTESFSFQFASTSAADVFVGTVIFASITSIVTTLTGAAGGDTIVINCGYVPQGDPLPANAVVVRAFYDNPTGGGAKGILTSGGAAQVSIGLRSLVDLKAAAVLGTNFPVGSIDTLITGAAATQIKTLRPTVPVLTTTVAALTGGRSYLYLEYVVSDN